MTQISKEELLEEAKKQSEALGRISRWRSYFMVLSAVGVVVAYMGFSGSPRRTVLGMAGVVLILAGIVPAVICNMVIRAGRENVEKILNAAEKQTDSIKITIRREE